jgi:hypothetical protein
VEPHRSRRVGNGGGQVVHVGVLAGARRCTREAFDDGGPITPPSQRSLLDYKVLWVRGFFNLFSGSNLFHHTNLRPSFLVGKDTSWLGMLGLRCLVHGTQGQRDVQCV